ncbi:MAG: YARHG domain-containing protein [Saprospiraceae bacterium]|nr:YARHG domain-containing protein [Saprospiraceae bacterium]
MKKTFLHFFPLLLSIFIMACGGSGSHEAATADAADSTAIDSAGQASVAENAAAVVPADKNPDGIGGYYVGYFEASEYDEKKRPSYSNKITVSIDSVVANMLYGHSIVAGNMRPFSGPINKDNKTYKAEVKEPGDDKYDGAFSFAINTENQTVAGSWSANNKKLPVTKREYILTKKEFKYDPALELPETVRGNELYSEKAVPDDFYGEFEAITEAALKVNASTKLLNKKDVENMYKGDLEVVRNAIYARHGYSFKNRKMRYVFDSAVEWYMPLYTDVRDKLTDIEKKNMDLLKRYEEHAVKYYDEYGR